MICLTFFLLVKVFSFTSFKSFLSNTLSSTAKNVWMNFPIILNNEKLRISYLHLECNVIELCVCIEPLQVGVYLDIGATPVGCIVELIFGAPFFLDFTWFFLLLVVNKILAELTSWCLTPEATSSIFIFSLLFLLDAGHTELTFSLFPQVISNWIDG